MFHHLFIFFLLLHEYMCITKASALTRNNCVQKFIEQRMNRRIDETKTSVRRDRSWSNLLSAHSFICRCFFFIYIQSDNDGIDTWYNVFSVGNGRNQLVLNHFLYVFSILLYIDCILDEIQMRNNNRFRFISNLLFFPHQDNYRCQYYS